MISVLSLKKARGERYSGDAGFPFCHCDLIFSDCSCKICEQRANNMAAVRIRNGEKDQQRWFIANRKILHQMIRIGSQLAPTSRNLSPRYHPSQGLSMLYFAFSFFFF